MALEFFHIRENDYDMLEQLIRLEQELHSQRGAGLNSFEVSSFIKYGRVYVAVDYDEVLGCVYFLRDFENPGKVFLYCIDIKPAESVKNIGISLLISAFGDLKESGVRMAEVMVDPSNYKALKIYREQLNFNVINTPDEDGHDEGDLLILRKTLV